MIFEELEKIIIDKHELDKFDKNIGINPRGPIYDDYLKSNNAYEEAKSLVYKLLEGKS